MFRLKRGTAKGLCEILPYVKIPLVANAHPLQVDPWIGLLRTLEGFSLVCGRALPDHPFVGSWPVLSSRARNGFDLAVDQRNYFPVGHIVASAPRGVFYHPRRCNIGPNRDAEPAGMGI